MARRGRQPHKTRFKKSQATEKRIAKELGGRALPRSGGLPWDSKGWDPNRRTAEGDLTTDDFLIEHKRIEPQVGSIGVKRQWLQKVTSGAKRLGKYPAMVVTFEGATEMEQDWALIPMSLMKRLVGKLQTEE